MDPASVQPSFVNAKKSGALRGSTNPEGDQRSEVSKLPGKVMSMLSRVKAEAPKALTEQSAKVVPAEQEDISKKKVDKRLIAALRLKKLNRPRERRDESAS